MPRTAQSVRQSWLAGTPVLIGRDKMEYWQKEAVKGVALAVAPILVAEEPLF